MEDILSLNSFYSYQRWMPEVAMAFVTLRESWRGLVPMKRRESLAQVYIFSINFDNVW